MAKKIMVLGTCSNAGKSLIVAGICRILTQDGYHVAPFKAQNLALNSYITKDGMEMGRAQVMQAEACRIEPDHRMNPILLKPSIDSGTQVVCNGEVLGNFNGEELLEKKEYLRSEVKKSFNSLDSEYDVIVLEGAGSCAEINLMENDMVNMGMAKMADAPVFLVGDIDRGGVFASLAGTMLLLAEEDRARVKGVLINKFRGRQDILAPGLEKLTEIIGVPVAGVIPYLDVDIDEEDCVTEKFSTKGSAEETLVDIAVIRVPHISNFTDFDALNHIRGINVRYADKAEKLGNPHMLILPGSKNTMSDLKWIRDKGFDRQILDFAKTGKPIFGICGGYQMLGQKLKDPLGVEYGGEMDGLGLLPHSTVFAGEKIRTAETGILADVGGIFSGLSKKKYTGYEMHMGTSKTGGNIINNGNIYGTYIHGIFDEAEIAKTVAKELLRAGGFGRGDVEIEVENINEYKQRQYDILADGLRGALDMELLYSMIK